MVVCTFYGHRDADKIIEPKLMTDLVKLVEQCSVDTFYVGNHGNFDKMVAGCLNALSTKYPHIKYSIVLAYLPGKRAIGEQASIPNSIYPEGLEKYPPVAAIKQRNLWMLKRAQYVVCAVESTVGNSAEMMQLAQKQGKRVINII